MSGVAQYPKGWSVAKFGDVVRQVKKKVDPIAAGLERYVAGDHMDTDDLRIRRWGTVRDGYLGPAFTSHFLPGQVLYGSRRTYLRKVAVADFEGVCANTTFVLESRSSDLLPGFLPYVMTTERFHEHSVKQSKGSVNPYINFRDLTWYEFALPPIDEQQSIVEVLSESCAQEERFSSVEKSIGGLARAMAHEVAERSAEMGSLTAVKDLVEHNRPVTYGILKPGTGFPGGVPVIKVRDFPNGSIDADGLLRTPPEIDAAYKRSRLRSGDLLISIRGTVGRIAEVPAELENANITQDTARLSILHAHDTRFVRWMLGSEYVQKQIQSRVTGLAVKGLNIGALRQILVPTPPLDEQQHLALRFSSLDELLSRCRSQIQLSKAVTKSLRASLLGTVEDNVH